jgi:hypothetical protein
MFDVTRDHMIGYLAERRLCVIGAGNLTAGVCLFPAPCRAAGLALDCVLPLWADLTFRLEQDPSVSVVLPPAGHGPWLQIRGLATPLAAPEWSALLPEAPRVAPSDLYRVVRIHARRIDALDERLWCARETLELEGDENWH